MKRKGHGTSPRDWYPPYHPVRFSRLTFSVVVTERLLQTRPKAVLRWPSLERSVNVLLPIANIVSQITPNGRRLPVQRGHLLLDSPWLPQGLGLEQPHPHPGHTTVQLSVVGNMTYFEGNRGK